MLGSADKGKLLGSGLSQIYILGIFFIEKKKKDEVNICKSTRTPRRTFMLANKPVAVNSPRRNTGN